MSETYRQLERIRTKLRLARVLSPFLREASSFRLGVPLALSEIEKFEATHRFQLPEGYRDFLLQLGNGGAGPYYGLSPLEKWSTWFEDEATDDPDFLCTPSPLIYEQATSPMWSKVAPPLCTWGNGSIFICALGCAYSARLIVTGRHAGRVVYLDADGQVPYFVRDRTFLDWYERWLSSVLRRRKFFWFGMDNPDYQHST